MPRNFVQKLYRYGFKGISLDLMKSYISDWKQCVCFNGIDSGVFQKDLGVIQGSKSVPLFFDLYSNDIIFSCDFKENILIADDTCLIYVNNDLDYHISHVNHDKPSSVSIVIDCCRYNKLAINPSKSEYMSISNKKAYL